jgi:DNA-binding HxlR family transcriptional regulator
MTIRNVSLDRARSGTAGAGGAAAGGSGADTAGLDSALRRIGDRWSLRVVGALLEDDRTFGELAADVDGIAPNILTARLRSLQADGLVVATPYERRPVRMRYSLSDPGRRLATAIASLAEWGARREGRGHTARHDVCGTPLETRPWCPTCEHAVDHANATDVIWA